ncbi:hypothetical protein SAY87_011911 [Trapa incisa]|uniref:HIG1 domain-containing protein n=1 Tax=Trapa incisa TaxID=236973 RepID=A0AAN7JIK6_9MYRT|nr:hypothetical protein SAY87_011911 [Trapa incisa]
MTRTSIRTRNSGVRISVPAAISRGPSCYPAHMLNTKELHSEWRNRIVKTRNRGRMRISTGLSNSEIASFTPFPLSLVIVGGKMSMMPKTNRRSKNGVTHHMGDTEWTSASLREWIVDHKLRTVGCLWLSGITGSIAYNWSQPNMKTSVKIIHARLHAQALTLAALAGAAVVEYYDHRTGKKAERYAKFLDFNENQRHED